MNRLSRPTVEHQFQAESGFIQTVCSDTNQPDRFSVTLRQLEGHDQTSTLALFSRDIATVQEYGAACDRQTKAGTAHRSAALNPGEMLIGFKN